MAKKKKPVKPSRPTRSSSKRWLWAVPAVLAAGVLAFLLFHGKGSPFASLTGGRDYNYVLITVDTLRADHVHCYGFTGGETPTIDRLASRGVRFEHCIAQTPLTLPSHTSIMTGTLPLFHGVRDNGGFLVPGELVTLAEVFKERGYETSAFVAAYVLDSKWGLDQGFDHYFDNFDFSKYEKISLGSVQRPANEVMDEALAWLEDRKDKKFFTWIHLYDPHTPYEPPPDFAARYPNRPYVGEIAFADSQLGRLTGFLESLGLGDDTMIIFAADHGESLGEHQESTHGFFVYQEAIHVPLIVSTPFPTLWGKTVPGVVSLADIMPTVLEMADAPVPAQVQGRSLVPLLLDPGKKTDVPAYAETFYPRFHFGWSELQSFQDGRYKLIIAPDPELYDLVEDPEERRNLASSEPGVTRDLRAKADSFIARRSENAHEIDLQKVDEETREKLAALGYIGSFSDSSKTRGKVLGNPKEKIHVFNELSRAREMGMAGEVEEATRIIKDIIAEDPDIIDAYFTLGNIYFKQENFAEAIRYFQESLDRKPDDSMAIINIANAYRLMGELEDAERILLESIDRGISDSQYYFVLASIKAAMGQEEEAIRYYEQCIDVNSESSSSHNALAVIYIARKDLMKAEAHLERAAEINPQLPNVNYNRAQILEEKKDFPAAAEAYRTELELSPKHFRSAFNLSRVMRLTGRTEEEEKYLRLTMEINPKFPMSYFYLARIYLNRGEKFEEAVDLVEKGIELKPEPKDLPLGYFLLADLHNRLGNEDLAREYALKGQELVRSNSGEKNR